MSFFKKYKIEIIFFILLIFSYFFLRCIRILNTPMFTDEAIYTRWTQIALQDHAERFISLTDGKQPLYIWINMFFIQVVRDPLLSGRLVSVFAGFLTMIGLFFLAKTLFKNRWIGIFTMLLYVLSPFALVYDRLALYDSLVGTFYIWSLYGAVILVKKVRVDRAIVLGLVLGGGALNKSIGLYAMYLLPVNVLLFSNKEKGKWKLLGKWIIFVCIAACIAEAMYMLLRLSPWFYIIKQKNATFFYSLSDVFHKPIGFWVENFLGNFHGLLSWFIPYMTLPLVMLVGVAFLFYKEFWREKMVLFIYFIVPFVGLALLAKVLYPRYIFFMTLPLLPIISYSFFKIFAKIKNISVCIVACLLLLSVLFYTDFYILTNFANSPIPETDRNQFTNDWPAGGGLRRAIKFFKKQSGNKNIYIGTEGTFGLLPYGLEIYLQDNPHITIQGFWPIGATPPKEVVMASKTMPTYFIFYQPCADCAFSGDAPKNWHAQLVKRYAKGISKTYFSIYQVHP